MLVPELAATSLTSVYVGADKTSFGSLSACVVVFYPSICVNEEYNVKQKKRPECVYKCGENV